MKESGQAGGTLLRYRSVVGFYMRSVCMSVCTCRAPEDKKVRGTLSWGGETHKPANVSISSKSAFFSIQCCGECRCRCRCSLQVD